MLKLCTSLFAAGLIVASGVMHGLWTDRWRDPVEPAKAAQRFEKIPMVIGEWQGEELDHAKSRPDLGIAGAAQRRYVNQRNGQAVLIALVCGRPGPVSIHSPDACYTASGFTVDEPRRVEVPEQNASFWMANALRTRASERTNLRIYWAWNPGNGWTASDSPRVDFARKPVLHKLYVIRERGDVEPDAASEPCTEFMQVLLPELDRVLFSEGEIR